MGTSAASRLDSAIRRARPFRSASVSFGRPRAATTASYASESSRASHRNSWRARRAAPAIARTVSCDAAYFSFESVRAATISARAAPIAAESAAAVPPPGVGESDEKAASRPSNESFSKSIALLRTLDLGL